MISVCDFIAHCTGTPAKQTWLHDYKRGQMEDAYSDYVTVFQRRKHRQFHFYPRHYLKVKAKFTLEQATKAQRWDRSIPLLFH